MILGQQVWGRDRDVVTAEQGVIILREEHRVVYGFETKQGRERFVARYSSTEYEARELKYESRIDRYFIPDNVPATHSYVAEVSIPYNRRNAGSKLRAVK